ncbi:TIGR03943 family putative permease subunit [Nocardia arthritidis]|uniref:TIGR03943 family protein n=1 Tax=Nocardia arthritidis TaxID=228602 RepID=A0A6G9YPN8_9NOCA|nr:TIGR03943 family protein [Nocardia arthritidis]QIS14883.1 TIGR03943 family protein [Nocardia arthritidis]
MNRETQNVILLLIGGAMVKITLDGTYLRYVKPGLYPFLLASGIAVIALAVAAIVRDIRRGRASQEHEHGSGRSRWLLVAPVAGLLLIVPPALGAASVKSGTAPANSIGANPAAKTVRKINMGPMPPGDAPTMRMYDLIDRASYDNSGELDRREITVVGFLVRTEEDGEIRLDGSHSGWDLARVVITCCVADAQTLRVHLDGDLGPVSDGGWISVRGKVVPDSARSENYMTPTVTIKEFHSVPAPSQTYG